MQGQQNPQMAGGQPQQLQGHPTSVQFRHPFPPANLRPGMRVGLAGGPIQVGQTIIQMAFTYGIEIFYLCVNCDNIYEFALLFYSKLREILG